MTKEEIDFVAMTLADNIDQIEDCLRELPIDYTDRKEGFNDFIYDLLESEI